MLEAVRESLVSSKDFDMRFLLTFGAVALSLMAISQDCSDLTGQWINELGSVLVIEAINTDGSIKGEYRSSTGVDGKIFPLQGWINNDGPGSGGPPSIAFSVRWEGYSSITSWTGSCDEYAEGPRIKTLWHLVRPNQEFEWERVIANSSTFRPLK